jgi:hypothetical protein
LSLNKIPKVTFCIVLNLALGSTAAELDISKAAFKAPKTKFSMLTQETESFLKTKEQVQSVVLFGIEV